MSEPATSSAALLKNLTTLLEKYGLSQAEFARRAGVPTTTLNRVVNDLEHGSSPRLDTLDAIARGFGITVSELLAGEVPPDARPAPAAYLLGRQLSRLIEDFVASDGAGRLAILRAAEENAAASDRRRDEHAP